MPFGAPRRAAVEAMLIMLPRFLLMKCLAASRAISIAPVTLVAMTASKAARSISTRGLNTPYAGVVHQNIEIAKLRQDLAIGPLDVRFFGHIGMDRKCA